MSSGLFDTEGFPPRWECGGGWLDNPWLGWVHIVSDVTTGLAYVGISFVLVVFLRKRRGSLPAQGLGLLFAAFILACGMVHFVDALLFYTPVYRLSALAKAVTASVSCATVVALAWNFPALLAIRSSVDMQAEIDATTSQLKSKSDVLNETTRELGEKRDWMAIALQAGNMGVWECDMNTLTSRYDPTEHLLTGLGDPGELIPLERFMACVHPYDRQKLKDIIADVVENNSHYEHCFRFTTPAGEFKWLAGRGRVIDNPGLPKRFFGVNYDVTAQKELEEELNRTRLAAESASKAKSRFLANTSHEIRTPLTAILGCTDVLLHDPHGHNAQKILQVIKGQGEVLMRLLNDVLDLSKIEAQKLEIFRQPCSPRKIAEEVKSLVQSQAAEKGLAFSTEVADAVPPLVLTDAVRLRQVLLNLVSNAVKFTLRGEVRVALDVVARPDSSRQLAVSVIDTGVGIAAADIQAVFDTFHRVELETDQSHVAGGTGLGLAISRQLVKLLGGELTVSSQLRQGSTFTFTLPLVEVADETAVEGGDAPPTKDFPPDLRVKTLVAEDSPAVRFLLERIFDSFPAEVVFVADGVEALEAITAADHSTQPFGLLVLDMNMPRKSGYDVVKEVRSRSDSIRIIALTASAMAGDRESCLAAGCDAYLTKPIDWTALIGEVTRQCRRSPLSDSWM
ncbi:MAG: ATP-binding protein [Lacipirellulaceae bacterium]